MQSSFANIPAPVLGLALTAVAALLYLMIKLVWRELSTKVVNFEGKLSDLSKDVTYLKEQIASGPKEVEEKVTRLECGLNDLRLKVAEDSVTREEFRDRVDELKHSIHDLKGSIGEVDKITREQAQLLARIEASLQALLN